MKTVVLDTPGTVTVSATSSESYFGVCKDLLSPRGMIVRIKPLRYEVCSCSNNTKRLEGAPTAIGYRSLLQKLIEAGFAVYQFETQAECFKWLGEEFVEVR